MALRESYLQLETGYNVVQEGRLTWFILLQSSIYMADQIEIQIPKPMVNENTVFTATAYYRNRASKTAATPTTVRYKVDCLSTEQALVDWTSITTPDTNNDITVSATANAIKDSTHRWETREITVQADVGLTTQCVGKVRWRVKNLQGVS